jgi:hypothetical protein
VRTRPPPTRAPFSTIAAPLPTPQTSERSDPEVPDTVKRLRREVFRT